jgi:hypothetical protein
MICRDCRLAADFDALPGLSKIVPILDPATDGHERCRVREQRATAMQPAGCDCQHGEPRCVRFG